MRLQEECEQQQTARLAAQEGALDLLSAPEAPRRANAQRPRNSPPPLGVFPGFFVPVFSDRLLHSL